MRGPSITEMKSLCENWDKIVNQSNEMVNALVKNNRTNTNKIISLENCQSISKGLMENFEPIYCKLFAIPYKKEYYNELEELIFDRINDFLP